MAFPAQQTLKKRVAAVVQTDVSERLFGYGRLFLRLLHHGRQLLVVAYEDEFRAAKSAAVCRLSAIFRRSVGQHGQQTNDVGFQYLACFVDDGKVEAFQVEDVGPRGYH